MRNLNSAFVALLIFTLSIPGQASAAGTRADFTTISADTSIRADRNDDAGAFIKPEAARQSPGERSKEHAGVSAGYGVLNQRDAGPLFPTSLLLQAPASPSATVRRAFLEVYRL